MTRSRAWGIIFGTAVYVALLALSTCAHAQDDRYPRQTAHSAPASASSLISEMRRHLGGNPTGWAHVWCGRMLDIALRRTGHPPGSALARAYSRYGRPAGGPAPGVIAVWPHHVGVVTAVAGRTIKVISGNDGHRVRERERSVRGVIAWRMPS
jgi:hypothetical protein